MSLIRTLCKNPAVSEKQGIASKLNEQKHVPKLQAF